MKYKELYEGDNVKINMINSTHHQEKGKIIKVDAEKYWVEFKEGGAWFSRDKLELIREISEADPVSMDTKQVNEAILKALGLEVGDLISTSADSKVKVDGLEGIYIFKSMNYEGLTWNLGALSNGFTKLPKKPTLTSDERVILSNIDSKYKWIARDKDDRIWLFEDKPCRSGNKWYEMDGYAHSLRIFIHLFQFIKWEGQAYNISGLLGGE